RLLEQSSLRERTLLDSFLKASARGAASAVIGEEVFIVGPRGARLLRDIDPAVFWPQLVDELSTRSSSHQRDIETPSGSLSMRVEPVVVGRQIFGALLDVAADDVAFARGGSGFGRVDVAVVVAADAALTGGCWRNGHASLPGTGRVWTSILAGAAGQVEATSPLLITGEVGTGKLSLARAIHHERGLDEADLHIADCAMANDAWLEKVAEALASSDKTVVLRHVDLADGEVAQALSALLDPYIGEGGDTRMFATAGPMGRNNAEPAYQRLLDQLSVARLELPPLRRRSEDIPALVDQISSRYGTHALSIDPQAMAALKRAPWPGNIRQLETTIHGIVNSARGWTVTIDMLPSDVAVYSNRRPLTPMEQMEFEAILAALSYSRGNKMTAARMLGIARSTLYRKMTSYQLDPDLKFF
ncbi:MAG: helix-turn-helix domain-containing protein, partial [Acidimicrobiales bacterium]